MNLGPSALVLSNEPSEILAIIQSSLTHIQTINPVQPIIYLGKIPSFRESLYYCRDPLTGSSCLGLSRSPFAVLGAYDSQSKTSLHRTGPPFQH